MCLEYMQHIYYFIVCMTLNKQMKCTANIKIIDSPIPLPLVSELKIDQLQGLLDSPLLSCHSMLHMSGESPQQQH